MLFLFLSGSGLIDQGYYQRRTLVWYDAYRGSPNVTKLLPDDVEVLFKSDAKLPYKEKLEFKTVNDLSKRVSEAGLAVMASERGWDVVGEPNWSL